MQTYIARCGKPQLKPSLRALMAAIRADGNTGFCLACGNEATGIEPDARRATCDDCGAAKVYGAEQLLLMRLYHE